MKKLLKKILNWFSSKPIVEEKLEPVAPVVKHQVRRVTHKGKDITEAVNKTVDKPKKKPAAKKPAVKK